MSVKTIAQNSKQSQIKSPDMISQAGAIDISSFATKAGTERS